MNDGVHRTAPLPLIEAKSLSLSVGAPRFDFALMPGEMVGLGGLDGHGQERFLRVLAGVVPPAEGRVTVGGGRTIRTMRAAYRYGVVYLPRDRKTQGIFPTMSVLDNFRMLTLERSSRLGIVSRRRARHEFSAYVERLGVVMPSTGAPITSLSGGNQQKVLIARLLAADPRVLLLNDPTRGVDHPTRVALYKLFEELAAEADLGIVVLSTEVDELITHTHRTVVFREGSPFVELEGSDLTRSRVLAGMFGMDEEAA